MSMKTGQHGFKFFCSFHLGDQLFLLWFLNNAAKRHPDLQFSFYVEPGYCHEIKALASKLPNLEITDQKDGHDLEGWMGLDGWYGSQRDCRRFVDFILNFHQYIAQKYGLPDWPLCTKDDLLIQAENLNPEHPLKGRAFDVLVVNSDALSGECGSDYNKEEFNRAIVHLARSRSVVTTHPCGHDDIPCTTSLGLTLSQLGELASHCQVVSGVANAPFLATFNELTNTTVKRWLNYSHDLVNFNDRVSYYPTMNSFKLALLALGQ